MRYTDEQWDEIIQNLKEIQDKKELALKEGRAVLIDNLGTTEIVPFDYILKRDDRALEIMEGKIYDGEDFLPYGTAESHGFGRELTLEEIEFCNSHNFDGGGVDVDCKYKICLLMNEDGSFVYKQSLDCRKCNPVSTFTNDMFLQYSHITYKYSSHSGALCETKHLWCYGSKITEDDKNSRYISCEKCLSLLEKMIKSRKK